MNGVKKDFLTLIFFKEKVPVKRKFFIQGKEKNVLVIRKFALSEFVLSGTFYIKIRREYAGKSEKVRVNRKFVLSEFVLSGNYCILFSFFYL